MENTGAKFKVGTEYGAFFAGDYEATVFCTVTRRTAKSVWINNGENGKEIRKTIKTDSEGNEFFPMESYTGAPHFRANRPA